MNLSVQANNQVMVEYFQSVNNQQSKDLWVDITTGNFHFNSNDLIQSQKDSEQWKAIPLKIQKNHVCYDSDTLNKMTTVARKTFLNSIISFQEQVLNPQLDIFINSFDKFNTNSHLMESVKECFGVEAACKIHAKTNLSELAQLVFSFAKQRLAEPKALDENEIKKIYHLLFSTSIARFAANEQDFYHPAVIFKQLMGCVTGFEKLGYAAKKPTGSGETFSGVNGSYFISNENCEKMIVFKPENEEKDDTAKGIQRGDGAKREHLACVINEDRLYPIPYTCYVQFQGQKGSAQMFLNNFKPLNMLRFDSETHAQTNELPKRGLHASLIFDIQFENLDRHLGNLMCKVDKKDQTFLKETSMIDNGLCLPSEPSDPIKMEQLVLPQMMETWDESLIDLFLQQDIDKNAELMKKHGIQELTIQRARRTHTFLKMAFQIAKTNSLNNVNINPFDLGLVAIKNYLGFWNDEDAEKLLKLIECIVPLKQKILDEKPSRAKMVILRRNFAKEHPEFNDTHISCLFGAAANDQSPERLDFSQSIIGKFVDLNK